MATRRADAEPLWSTAEAATYLGVPVATLHQWGLQGNRPTVVPCRPVATLPPQRTGCMAGNVRI